MSGTRAPGDELQALLDTAVAALRDTRRTFTDEQALRDTVWAHNYDIGPQHDPRFVLVQEGQGPGRPRQWRLSEHTVANNVLLDRLLAHTWDGRDVDAELVRLDGVEGGHHVFCSTDSRFVRRPDGRLAPAREQTATLDVLTRQVLDSLAPQLMANWQAAGAAPRTIRQIVEALSSLGWPDASARGATVTVRTWLLDWPQVLRVGPDYWVPASALPKPPTRRRLQVLPVSSPASRLQMTAREQISESQAEPKATLINVGGEIPTAERNRPERIAAWTQVLRTVHLVEGFLPLPAAVRAVVPPQAPGASRWEVLPGKWYDTGDVLWIWLDREGHRLCGPDLAAQLAWCSAGERLRLTWTSEVLLLQTEGMDATVQQQEMRLVDRDALAQLRGGLGETYRRSILAVLADHPNGLSFRELVAAVCERQRHAVHPGTIRAILSAGGFEQRDGRWCLAPGAIDGARRFRHALLATLSPAEGTTDQTKLLPVCEIARTIRARLQELQIELRGDRAQRL